MSDYPEHEKLAAIREQSQAIGEFLDFGPWTLCEYREAGTNGQPWYRWCEGVRISKRDKKPTAGRNPDHYDYFNDDAEHNPDFEEWHAGYVPIRKPIQTLLAEYFGIDRDALENEKRAMLATLRAGSA